MAFLFEQYPAAVSIGVGLLLVLWPPPRHDEVERERQARLAELAAGAPERHFEERRALETYGPQSGGPYRFWGILMVVLGVAMLTL